MIKQKFYSEVLTSFSGKRSNTNYNWTAFKISRLLSYSFFSLKTLEYFALFLPENSLIFVAAYISALSLWNTRPRKCIVFGNSATLRDNCCLLEYWATSQAFFLHVIETLLKKSETSSRLFFLIFSTKSSVLFSKSSNPSNSCELYSDVAQKNCVLWKLWMPYHVLFKSFLPLLWKFCTSWLLAKFLLKMPCSFNFFSHFCSGNHFVSRKKIEICPTPVRICLGSA